ncbi:MAG: TolC family outer membrane protein [Pacificimonas sp.]|jgi:outer membrane protein|nr:TolC family outer membrane protein [Pacificimonas sp.]
MIGARTAALLMAAAASVMTGTTASAETLKEAMAAAYATNPQITAARAGQRVNDEELVRAKQTVLPTIGANTFLDQETTGPAQFDDLQRQVIGGVELRQPVFTFGRTKNGIRAADRGVLAGRQLLRGTENQLMLDVVTVYMDVLTDQSEVELTTNNVSVLERQLQATTDRFEVGDVTRTDVAQSEARLALARSQNIAAQANLESSRYAYEQVVGHPPVDLQPPPALPALPADTDEAVEIALNLNPFVQSARLQEEAQAYRVRQTRGQLYPTLEATLRAGYVDIQGLNQQFNIPFSFTDWTQNIRLTATIPIFSGGQIGSQVRSAKALAVQRREEALSAERQTISQVRTAAENLLAARATINASALAVDANELALEGTRAELTVGTRNILDVLNAEQELLTSQVQLVRAERNSYVAAFALLAAMGRAEADDLGVPVRLYDAERYLDRADDHWFDWTAEFDPQPVTTEPTVPVPAPTVRRPLPDPTPEAPSADEVLATEGDAG